MDKILRIALPELSLSLIHRLLRTGKIRLNDQKTSAAERVAPGDRLLVNCRAASASQLAAAGKHWQARRQPESLPPAAAGQAGANALTDLILYENDDLVFVNKPKGLLTHGPDGLDNLAAAYLATKVSQSLAFRPAPLHRLDRNTSGLLAISASLRGAQLFSAALAAGQLRKSYLALLDGQLDGEATWSNRLARDSQSRQTRVTSDGHGQLATSRVTSLASTATHTLAHVVIESGRTHQIRVQCAAHGHPLSGDCKYGGSALPGGYLLHAWKLQFPAGLELALPATLVAPLPLAFRQALAQQFDCIIEQNCPFLLD